MDTSIGPTYQGEFLQAPAEKLLDGQHCEVEVLDSHASNTDHEPVLKPSSFLHFVSPFCTRSSPTKVEAYSAILAQGNPILPGPFSPKFRVEPVCTLCTAMFHRPRSRSFPNGFWQVQRRFQRNTILDTTYTHSLLPI